MDDSHLGFSASVCKQTSEVRYVTGFEELNHNVPNIRDTVQRPVVQITQMGRNGFM